MTETWIEALAEFLRREPGVEAVRLDPVARKVHLATLGEVDLARLGRRLEETLAALDRTLADDAESSAAPAGFALRRGADGAAELIRPSCATAPGFWKWREFAWPELREEEAEEPEDWRELAGFALACGGLGLLGWWLSGRGEAGWIGSAAYGLALVAGGWDAAKDSWENLRRAKVDIHFLMLAVAVGAVAIGAWGEAVLLLFLFSASGAMEAYALDRTHRAVGGLLKSAPREAARLEADGVERRVPIGEITIGDVLRVRPGEAYAADGEVRTGESASDESTLTGEATPVDKAPGAPVFSGTLNLWGVVEMTVRRLPAESTLQRVIRLIQTAQKLRAPSERFTDRFGGGYTLVVLGVCAAMFLIWWLGLGLPAFGTDGGQPSAFYRAMTLMVVMSPCALVLSIPSAILAAIAWGARHGVLFRGGAAIEKLAGVGVVALDKTGTLTTGELAVETYESFPPGREQEVRELALALEVGSEHPLARAIVRDARARGVRERRVDAFEAVVGRGVRGRLDGVPVMLGRRELLEEGPLAEWARGLPSAPAEFAEVWVVSPGLIGRVLLRDQLRRESRGVLDALRRDGVRTVMLTGDRRATAEAVARELGVDEVRAGLSPAGKVRALTELKAAGRPVAMVGDGVNDAPSLAAADVSIAMGARGSDAALEQAEIVLMHDRIENVLAAFDLSRRAQRVIRQNLAISLGVVVAMAIASVAGVVPLGLGVAAHEGSTVLVCLNSLRLLAGCSARRADG